MTLHRDSRPWICALFVLSVATGGGLALGFIEPLHDNPWAALTLHALLVAIALLVSVAASYSMPWPAVVGVGALLAIIHGSTLGLVRSFCLFECPPQPLLGVLPWLGWALLVSAGVVAAFLAGRALTPANP